MSKQMPANQGKKQAKEKEQEPPTKDEFLKFLDKVTRRVPKTSHKPEKKETGVALLCW